MEVNDIKDLLELIICVLGVVIPLFFLIKEHYGKKKRELAQQVIAYYCLQEEAVKWIETIASTAKKVKVQLRERASKHEDNVSHIYPKMTIKEASKYL